MRLGGLQAARFVYGVLRAVVAAQILPPLLLRLLRPAALPVLPGGHRGAHAPGRGQATGEPLSPHLARFRSWEETSYVPR